MGVGVGVGWQQVVRGEVEVVAVVEMDGYWVMGLWCRQAPS